MGSPIITRCVKRKNVFSGGELRQIEQTRLSELLLTSTETLDTLVSRGNERVRNVNFGVSLLDQLAENNASSSDRNLLNPQAAIVDSLFTGDDPLV